MAGGLLNRNYYHLFPLQNPGVDGLHVVNVELVDVLVVALRNANERAFLRDSEVRSFRFKNKIN